MRNESSAIIALGSASRVPAGRFAAPLRRRRKAIFRCGKQFIPETNPLRAASFRGPATRLVSRKKEKPHGTRKTRHQAPTKGFFLTKSKLYQSAQEAANRADRYAFRDRRAKKRQYRRLWIQRIGAAARLNGLTYGQLIHGLKAAGVALDRKVLADIAVKDAPGFAQLAAKAKAAAPPQAKAKKA